MHFTDSPGNEFNGHSPLQNNWIQFHYMSQDVRCLKSRKSVCISGVFVCGYIVENRLPMACAKAITTSWQVVASVTPQTTLWTPSTQTLSSMLGQKRWGFWLWCVGPDIIEGSSGAGQLKPLWLLHWGGNTEENRKRLARMCSGPLLQRWVALKDKLWHRHM